MEGGIRPDAGDRNGIPDHQGVGDNQAGVAFDQPVQAFGRGTGGEDNEE